MRRQDVVLPPPFRKTSDAVFPSLTRPEKGDRKAVRCGRDPAPFCSVSTSLGEVHAIAEILSYGDPSLPFPPW
jgi:hypothetical protein